MSANHKCPKLAMNKSSLSCNPKTLNMEHW